MRYIIDRFEGEYAVIELKEKEFVNIPRMALPPEAKEGDVILVTVDRAVTEKRRGEIENMMKSIWAD